ncbi:MAG: DUF1353 domain-containing protein [Bryobacterales bacterium]|nr:DUF1353 domain-containing protein [Bryobacterales bacterium]
MSVYPQKRVKILGFRYESDLHLMRNIEAVQRRQGDDALYVVARDYSSTVIVREGREEKPLNIVVPCCFLTDLASVPKWARAISGIGRVGPHLEASVIHDWLYAAWQHEDVTPVKRMRRFADQVFRQAMLEAGADEVSLIYNAVRAGGETAFFAKDELLFDPR